MVREIYNNLVRLIDVRGCAMDIKILVCDDDIRFVQKLVALIQNQPHDHSCAVSVKGCSDPSLLTDEILSTFNVIFLDIDMGKYNGLEIARRVRALQLDTILIFVTNYVEFSPEGYEVRAFRYLIKSRLEEKLPGYFQEMLKELYKHTETMSFSISGETYYVKYNNILYLESRQRTICLHTIEPERTGKYFYATMEDMANQLKTVGSLRIQKSYLVNMAHIRKLNYDKVLLDTGEILPVSQKNYAQIKSDYLNWRSKQ